MGVRWGTLGARKRLFGSFLASGCFCDILVPSCAIFVKSPGGPWDPLGTLWCPWGEPWGLLGSLGASWEVLGGPVGALRISWGALGSSWGALGGPLWPPGAPRGAHITVLTAQAQSNREVPWSVLEAPWGLFGRPWDPLGRPWDLLVGPWGPSGPPLAPLGGF